MNHPATEMTTFATQRLLHEIQNLTIEEVRQCVRDGDLSARDKKGNTCLHIGVSCGSADAAEICRIMLEAGADVEGLNDNSETPLVWAIYLGLYGVAKVLLDHGANKDITVEGATLQHFAAASVLPRSLEFLNLTCQADFNVIDHEGKTPLMYAAERDLALHIKWLIASGVDVLHKDQEGETALFKAVRHNAHQAMWALLEFEPYKQLRIRNVHHVTVIQVAESMRSPMHSRLRSLAERQNVCFLACFDRWTDNAYRLPSRRITALKLKVYFLVLISLVIVQCVLYFLPKHFYEAIALLGGIGIGIVLYILLNFSNPGFIHTSVISGSNRDLEEKASVDTMKESLLPSTAFNQHIADYEDTIRHARDKSVCITCKSNVPFRSKHCKELDRCVYRYDHFCPFIGTAIGRSNHGFFILFLTWFLAVMGWYFYLSILSYLELKRKQLSPIEKSVLIELILGAIAGINCFLMLIFDLSLLISHLYLVAQNMTTNEWINHTKYDYLNEGGVFHNSFNRGCCRNCCEFWCFGSSLDPKPLKRSIDVENPLS